MWHANRSCNDKEIEQVGQMTSADNFRPKALLSNGHAQTLWRKFAPVPSVTHRRQRVELTDGDFIDLDWSQPSVPSSLAMTGRPNNGMVILLLHGLCGCSQSGYIQSLQHRLGETGYTSVAMNFRGCSGETNRLAKAYHSGVTADLGEIFQVLRKQHPDSSFAAAGFSLGANVLLKWLGEEGEQSFLQRAVAVSTPFNLTICSQAMLEGLSQMYGRYFLRRLVADVENKKAAFEQSGNQEQLELLRSCGDLTRVSSLWDFDDRVTAPLHGFDDAHDYYEQCSSIRYLADIAVPTALLQSLDDPIIPPHALPDERHLSDALVQDFFERGGHVGFASASGRYWLEDRIISFITA